VKPAVFLDRDGTMIHDVGYLRRVEEVRWFPSTVDAIRLLNRAGFLVCVTTNQSGIGRGHYTEADLAAIHGRLDRFLAAAGARVDAWFYCPHHPQAEVEAYRAVCECRKPRPGMIRRAGERFAIDLDRSFVIGDKLLDLGLAVEVGARGVLVRTGYGLDIERAHNGAVPGAAFIASDLMEATSWVLMASGRPRGAA
jgi:D-glycero-D-manno-heptose 1,7-bisphosphate phosphatase